METDVPYAVVKACRGIGFERPEDVVWVRIGFDGDGSPLQPAEQKWCRCTARYPNLQKFVFTWEDGTRRHYWLAQCVKCRRIHWDGPDRQRSG